NPFRWRRPAGKLATWRRIRSWRRSMVSCSQADWTPLATRSSPRFRKRHQAAHEGGNRLGESTDYVERDNEASGRHVPARLDLLLLQRPCRAGGAGRDAGSGCRADFAGKRIPTRRPADLLLEGWWVQRSPIHHRAAEGGRVAKLHCVAPI